MADALKYARALWRAEEENRSLRLWCESLTKDNARLREKMMDVQRRALWGSDLRRWAAKLGVPQEELVKRAAEVAEVAPRWTASNPTSREVEVSDER